ncbi:MAG: hypothetical protein COB66_03580 [Coxiella sp. (in: Bacteria)]|nr:MAG: hypothetical protein COB66_03580 [Coxiella sp. (in: g-proteobacteria)]
MGYENVMAITASGVYGVGKGCYGTLGIEADSEYDVFTARRVPALERLGVTITKIVLSETKTLILTEKGDVYFLGLAGDGCKHFEPCKIQLTDDSESCVIDVAVTEGACFLLTRQGSLHSMDSKQTQLCLSPARLVVESVHKLVQFEGGFLALSCTGKVYTLTGELDNIFPTEEHETAQVGLLKRVDTLSPYDIVDIFPSNGATFGYAQTRNGRVIAWNSSYANEEFGHANSHAELGLGHTDPVTSPEALTFDFSDHRRIMPCLWQEARDRNKMLEGAVMPQPDGPSR